MKMNYNVENYEVPQVEIIEVEVEKGFALSINAGDIDDMTIGTW